MTRFDVFNGDADGICALIQLRNAEPCEAQIITGVKRDICLLQGLDVGENDSVTVLDISMEKNRTDLQRILGAGANVFYVDHHFSGEIPKSGNLKAIINEAPDTCTSILVNTYLKGRFINWAITGAFGDNLKASARALAAGTDLSSEEVSLLENLGICVNYNGYGSSLKDLHFDPGELYQKLVKYADPLEFIRDGNEDYAKLNKGYRDDMAAAESIIPSVENNGSAIYIFPNEGWARRVSGVFSNDLANAYPNRAHAVLTEKSNGNYLVSVRAPLNKKTGAMDLCRLFPTGGGRAAAAGINDLPSSMLTEFEQKLATQWQVL